MLESKEDEFGSCYIDFKINEIDGDMALNKQSERQECKTHGIKNRINFGPGWGQWEGWVQRKIELSKLINPSLEQIQ